MENPAQGAAGPAGKPEHPSLQRWLWKAKPLSPPFHSPSLPPPEVLPRSVTTDSASLIVGSGLRDCGQSSYEGCVGGVYPSVHRHEPGWARWTFSEAHPPSVPSSGFNKLSPLTGCRSPCTPTSLPGSTCPHCTWTVTVSPVTKEGPKGNDHRRRRPVTIWGRPKSCSLHVSQSHQRAAPDTVCTEAGRPARRPGSQHATASAARLPGHPALTLAGTSALTLTTRSSSPGTAWAGAPVAWDTRNVSLGECTAEAQLPGELLAWIQPCCSGWVEGMAEGDKASRGWGAQPAWQQPIPSNSHSTHPAPPISQECEGLAMPLEDDFPSSPTSIGLWIPQPNC